MNLLRDLWHNGVAGFAAVGLAFGAWLGAREIGFLDRPRYWLRSVYLQPGDYLGFFAMPHFSLEYENRGNVPVTFSDFELLLPRLDALEPDGTFTFHPGAELLIDKRPTSRLGRQQAFKYIDYRTNKVTLQPGESHTDFFDLEAFFRNVDTSGSMPVVNTTDFHPVLTFHDSGGNRYRCDEKGIHHGPYQYPHQQALQARAGGIMIHTSIEAHRRWLRWLGWTIGSGGEPNA